MAYLHHGLSKRIIHHNIKPPNIFLDQNDAAKLFDFECAIPIPWSKLREKSDVYSFGILLCEVLTGKKSSDGENSVFTWISYISEYARWPSDDISGTIVEEFCKLYPIEHNVRAQVMDCAKLVKRFVKRNPDHRPNMIEIEKALRLIKTTRY
ncbi:Tyrosine-protein kinase [Parasponia andersonii]|uniref:Tyrosine-protein kinase n=1 Tax=Parasponia andersonii TaxID=3476 RepID=A0A2P5DWX8_PARAD|nr:Tyrosine-protein kinase [Parasponia andersonii]